MVLSTVLMLTVMEDGYLLNNLSPCRFRLQSEVVRSFSCSQSGASGTPNFVNAGPGLPFNEGDADGALLDYDNDGLLDISIFGDSKYERNYPEETKGPVRFDATGR